MNRTGDSLAVIAQCTPPEVLAYYEVMSYPFMEAAYEIEYMLERAGIKRFAQLAVKSDVTRMIIARAQELDAESGLAGMPVTITQPFGRFFSFEHNVQDDLLSSQQEAPVSEVVERVALGEFYDEQHKQYKTCLGINVHGERTIDGTLNQGYYFLPFGGQNITIHPPPNFN